MTPTEHGAYGRFSRSIGVTSASVLLLALLATSCVTAPMEINPTYSTRSLRQVAGEVSLGEVTFDGDDSSFGAVRPADPLPYYCREALARELVAFGLRIDEKAPLRVAAEIRQAETEWKNQGAGGVFTTTFVIAFSLTDREERPVYRRIHRGVASHNQSYGGYPASAAFAEALATTYERFLQDPKLLEALKAGGSMNLFGGMCSGPGFYRHSFPEKTREIPGVSPSPVVALLI